MTTKTSHQPPPTARFLPLRLTLVVLPAVLLALLALVSSRAAASAVHKQLTGTPASTTQAWNFGQGSEQTLIPTETPAPPSVAAPTGILTATLVATPTQAITPTLTGTPEFLPLGPQTEPTITPTVTLTPTVTVTPTVSPTPTHTGLYLPLLGKAPPFEPAQGVLMCAPLAADLTIPDNQPAGVDSSFYTGDERQIVDLDLRVTVDHSWVGDLSARLDHQETGRSAELFDRPGYPSDSSGCEYNNVRAIFDDEMSAPVENRCAASPAALPGSFQPVTPLEIFTGLQMRGSWTLNLADHSTYDTGKLTGWCLFARLSPAPEPVTPTPEPPSLPSRVILSGVTGKPQALPLDCESRSAVDWAKYFGKSINELSFFNQLPGSKNPDKGFVGDVYGQWGQIPPDDYGVHAEPIAALLRAYGLPAYARRPMGWDWLRAEIAAGRPVIVWIAGNVERGIPVYFTPPDGLTNIVARYEHTVIVTGYTTSEVYYLNGSTIYTRPIAQFLDSWSALGNMAVAATP